MAAVPPEGEILGEWEVVQVAPHFTISIKHIRAWSRMVRGTLTISILRGFWGYLGNYLKEVKKRGL